MRAPAAAGRGPDDLSGTGCAVFAITPDSNISVTSATTVALDVQFTPVARGAASCHVPIFDHVSGTLIGAFDLTSSGIGAVLSAPASVGFGNVRVTPATAKSTQVVTLKNTGDDGTTLHITALAFGGLAPGDYSFATPPTLPIDVPASGQTTVSVVFNPTASGTRAATLTVTSDSVGAPTTNIALTGTGTNAVVGVSDLDFGIVHDGSSGAGNITISNTAAPPVGPLHVTSATLTDASGWFSFSSPACTGTINQNVSGTPITLGMTCTPTPADSTGRVTATVKCGASEGGTSATIAVRLRRFKRVRRRSTAAAGSVGEQSEDSDKRVRAPAAAGHGPTMRSIGGGTSATIAVRLRRSKRTRAKTRGRRRNLQCEGADRKSGAEADGAE